MRLPIPLPNRISWIALLGLLWSITFGGLRDFVWADLREGIIRLNGLNRVVRGLVILGFTLLFAMLLVLIFNDFWRQQFDLRPANLNIPGRGNLIPVIMLPVSLLLMTIAWSFALTGARLVDFRLGMIPLFVYVTNAVTGLASAPYASPYLRMAGWGALVLVVLLFLFPAARRWPADVCFLLFLALTGIQSGLIQTQLFFQDQSSGIGLGQLNLESSIQILQTLALPLLMFIGMDIASFVQHASTWTTQVVRKRLPDFFTYLVLIVTLGSLLSDQVTQASNFVQLNGIESTALAYLGGFGHLVIVLCIWWLINFLAARQNSAQSPTAIEKRPLHPEGLSENVEGWALWLILLRLATMLTAYIPYQFSAIIGPLSLSWQGELQNLGLLAAAILQALGDLLGQSALVDLWLWVLAAGTLLLGLWLAHRGKQAIALYLGAYGAYDLWNLATARNGPLAELTWDSQDQVHFWMAIWLMGVALVWLLRSRLTPVRAGKLIFLTLILMLLHQTDFIENPFSPFFGFAGIGFVAFGIAWDALTAGAWANQDTPFLPRTGRIFLYIGYVLLTVTLVNWALSTHNLNTIDQFTGEMALLGLNAFGKPLLYLLFPLVLALPDEESNEWL